MTHTHRSTIGITVGGIEGCDVPIVEYITTKGYAGDDECPGEPGHIEIESCRLDLPDDKREWELTVEQDERITEEIMDYLNGRYDQDRQTATTTTDLRPRKGFHGPHRRHRSGFCGAPGAALVLACGGDCHRGTVGLDCGRVFGGVIMAAADVLEGRAMWHVECSDATTWLRTLPDACIQCCTTSPPYFQQRDYGVDGQIGLEKQPREYVARLVEVFAEIHRVLRADGVLWLNLGDSYNSQPGQRKITDRVGPKQLTNPGASQLPSKSVTGLRPKNLIGIPWRVAFALQDWGWNLRSECIWHKTAAMPESVTDRPSRAHEHLFLLTKQPKYFYDGYAVRTPSSRTEPGDPMFRDGCVDRTTQGDSANLRSVISLGSEGTGESHFAVMPSRLVTICVQTGTSAHGCCPNCGAPWKRILSKERKATRPGNDGKVYKVSQTGGNHRNVMEFKPRKRAADEIGNRDPQRHCTTVTTLGWQQACKCPEAEPIGCVTLDPFTGAGTTGLVSRALNRRFIGSELNPEYAAIARRRIGSEAPLFDFVPMGPESPTMFDRLGPVEESADG